jgi:hypothetical protein
MLKNFKSLFVKTDEEEPEKTSNPIQDYSFPVAHTPIVDSAPPPVPQAQPSATDPIISDVLKTYESGLESINMPGYDFYEFYQTITVAGSPTEQSYKMAFQIKDFLNR